jgi:hypothetical protein
MAGTRWLEPQKHRKCKSSFRFFTFEPKKDDLELSQLDSKHKVFDDLNKKAKNRR